MTYDANRPQENERADEVTFSFYCMILFLIAPAEAYINGAKFLITSGSSSISFKPIQAGSAMERPNNLNYPFRLHWDWRYHTLVWSP